MEHMLQNKLLEALATILVTLCIVAVLRVTKYHCSDSITSTRNLGR